MPQLIMRRRAALRLARLAIVLAGLCLTRGALAEAAASASTAPQSANLSDPLPDLPKVPSSSFEKPTKEQLTELEGMLERARHQDALIRERAVREVLEVRPLLVNAIYNRLNRLADDADRSAMRELLRKIRDEARNVVRQKMRAKGKTGDVETPDYLTMVADDAKPHDEAWQNLMMLLTMSRMLVAIGDVRAARALIHIYVRFGEFIRVDTQLQLEKMGDRALAALIEARRHPAAKIGTWAERQLDLLGKAIPSETVQTEDPQVLADVLRAHGRIRDPDAARIVISFANSEKAQIRLAARQGVALFGEVGNWQLRDTYENIVGKRPRRDWSWKRIARELFAEFDRLRLARVHDLFDKGVAALKKRDFENACNAFDDVLAHNPMFDRRDVMVDAYVQYAQALPKEKLDIALLAARRAERTNLDAKRQKTLESLRLTLEAERELMRGVAEQVLFRRALELDPSNQRAREALAMIERGESEPKQDFSRYYAALAIAGAAVLAILLIALWRPKEAPQEPQERVAETPPGGEPALGATDKEPGPNEKLAENGEPPAASDAGQAAIEQESEAREPGNDEVRTVNDHDHVALNATPARGADNQPANEAPSLDDEEMPASGDQRPLAQEEPPLGDEPSAASDELLLAQQQPPLGDEPPAASDEPAPVRDEAPTADDETLLAKAESGSTNHAPPDAEDDETTQA